MTNIVFDSPRAPGGGIVFDVPTAEPLAPSTGDGGVISDAAFNDWLSSDEAITNVLVETFALVNGVRTRFQWSTLGYTTEGVANPVYYPPDISLSVPFREALSLQGPATLSAGDIEIDNTNGVNESLAAHIWADELQCWVGDVRWSRLDYRPILIGHTVGLERKGTSFALLLRDMMEGLNYPMSEKKFGGNGVTADTLVPLSFGESCNASGAWEDPAGLVRRWHDGPIEGIVEVRANMLPITEQLTVDNATGKGVLLVNNENATITATVQGDKFGGVFRKTIASLVMRFITGYGKDIGRYNSSNIDVANFADFDAANQQAVGLHVLDRLNVIDACALLASSVGAQLAPALEGKLQLIQIAIPAAGAARVITASHMLVDSLRHVERIEPVAAVQLGYCKVWTVQKGLSSNIPAEHRVLFESEWPLTVTRVSAAIKKAYRIDGEPAVMKPTMFLNRADAVAEADRLVALWGPGRDIYEFEGVPELLQIKKGQRIIVYHELDGMEAGVEAQVLEVERNWITREVKVRFLK
jgi:hypothetical protein